MQQKDLLTGTEAASVCVRSKEKEDEQELVWKAEFVNLLDRIGATNSALCRMSLFKDARYQLVFIVEDFTRSRELYFGVYQNERTTR